MKLSKLLSIALCSIVGFSSLAYAKKPEFTEKIEKKYQQEYEYEHKKMKKEKKEKKQKNIPYGLQKKVDRGGDLPPGWKRKIEKGEVADIRILKNGRVIYSKDYPYIKGTKVYEIEDKIIRVSNATREILDIFK